MIQSTAKVQSKGNSMGNMRRPRKQKENDPSILSYFAVGGMVVFMTINAILG